MPFIYVVALVGALGGMLFGHPRTLQAKPA